MGLTGSALEEKMPNFYWTCDLGMNVFKTIEKGP
jgi:hypothetical protein